MLYDFAYLELSFLLDYFSSSTTEQCINLSRLLAKVDTPDCKWAPVDLSGPCSIIKSGRISLASWIAQINLLSRMIFGRSQIGRLFRWIEFLQ